MFVQIVAHLLLVFLKLKTFLTYFSNIFPSLRLSFLFLNDVLLKSKRLFFFSFLSVHLIFYLRYLCQTLGLLRFFSMSSHKKLIVLAQIFRFMSYFKLIFVYKVKVSSISLQKWIASCSSTTC